MKIIIYHLLFPKPVPGSKHPLTGLQSHDCGTELPISIEIEEDVQKFCSYINKSYN